MTKVAVNNDVVMIVCSISDKGLSLKDAKRQILNVEGIDLDTAEAMQNLRTKAAFIAAASDYLEELKAPATEAIERKEELALVPVTEEELATILPEDNHVNLHTLDVMDELKELEPTVKAIAESRKETMPVAVRETCEKNGILEPSKLEKDVMSLNQYADEIKTLISSAQASFMRVGKLLCEVKNIFATQKEFLQWAEDACFIRKAQVYKLMKVYNVFGEDSVFNNVSMRVLYTLSSQPEEVLALAEEKAMDNELDSNALKGIIDTFENPLPVEVEQQIIEETGLSSETVEVVEEQADDTPPFEIDAPTSTMEELAGIAEPTENEVVHSEKVAELQEKLHNLNVELDSTKKELEQAKEYSLHYLPQFDSECMYARLGLSAEQATDKKAVNTAFRTLAKLFPSIKAPEASAKLKEARENLLG